MQIFDIQSATTRAVPIVISSPHSGTAFPEEIIDNYNPELTTAPDDTDWFIHKLYDFAPSLGITIISAKYSRWVVDLNRDPQSAPLYNDGRIITALCPTTSFAGENIYKPGLEPDQKEINRRINDYYWPYYQEIETRLSALKKQFGKVLFWDAHSIRQLVPLIRKESFPDLILGDNDEKSASKNLISTALSSLQQGSCQVNHNTPFKGGHLTRYFGKPDEHQHALQLEMTKINYMDDAQINYDKERANKMRLLLKNTFTNLLETLTQPDESL